MPHGVIKFEEYALDGDRYELLHAGRRIKLEKLPMELLILLVEEGGHLVTRQAITERLWGAGVFLDTEHGINTAIRKIRSALGDNAEQSRFVETVTGKGYRFIAPTTNEVSIRAKNTAEASMLAIESGGSGPIDFAEPVGAVVEPARASRSLTRFLSLIVVAAIATAGVGASLNIGRIRDRLSGHSSRASIHSIAVLPLESLSGDSSQEYFADGMTDELITMLAKNPGLRVISRTSVMQYKKASRALPAIARELGVGAILEGSVGRSGTRVHVNVQLVDGPSDTHLWAESYDRDLSDVGALQNELARTIARQVGSTVSDAPPPAHQIGTEAHDQYLLGRYYWFAEDYDKSREYFQKAIHLQPDYAAAWAGLADSRFAKGASGAARSNDVTPEGDAAARKAVALDDSLAEAHQTMAADYLFYRWDWQAAERESARALELNPGLAEAHHLRGYILQVLGRTEEAVQEQKRCMELDPNARRWAYGFALLQAHRFDAALEEGRVRSEAYRDDAGLHALLFVAYWHKGMEKQAAQEEETIFRLSGEKEHALAVHRAYERGGMNAVWELQLNRAQARAAKAYVSPLYVAGLYACLKRKEEALAYLEKAYAERVPWLVHVQSDAKFDFLHAEPRYQAIVHKMSLPPIQ